MSANRITYQNWIVDLGRSPGHDRNDYCPEVGAPRVSPEDVVKERERQEIVKCEVSRALAMLSEDEREFIERFYYIGQSYQQISEKSGRATHKLEAIHRRAFKKLKKELQPLVKRLYHLESSPETCCVICNSPHRLQIDLLIKHRAKSSTWRQVIRTIRREYGIKITTPQILIGHEKYH